MPPSPPRLVRFPVLVLLVLGILLPAVGVPAAAQPSGYTWPVDGQPVRGFDAPASPYGAGHRGVDLPVAPGDRVRPMAPGQVTFAGTVAGEVWATVEHADGIRTSYGPLRAGSHARRGQWLPRGGLVGHARGDAHGDVGLLHVGARRDGRYLDPASLVAGRSMVATLVDRGGAEVATGPRAGRRTLVPGAPPSPNHLVVLSGLTSRTGYVPFDLASLGYPPDAWGQYSYAGVDPAGDALAYGPDATWGRVHDMAVALRDQLRAHARDHPGQAVDLVGHSLGGLVGMYYLLVLHDATDPTLPPIGRIATVSSPLQGADSADAVARVRDSVIGRALLDLLQEPFFTDAGGDPVLHPDVAVLEDLRTDSVVARAVARAWQRHREDPFAGPLATGTEVLTIGSVLDPVVSEHRSGLPGADHEAVFDPNPVDAHEGATTDARSRELLAAFLGGEPLPSRDLSAHLVNATAGVGSRLVAALEDLVATGIWLSSEAVTSPLPG